MRYAVLTLAALALLAWYADRRRKVAYHRERYQHAKCHARPTIRRRALRAARRVLSLRIRITTGTNARTA